MLSAPLMQAHATTLSVSDIFSQFNVITFGNFSSTSDVEGRTVVGGNLTGGATFDLKPGSAAASSFASLTVYGNATYGGNANVVNGSGVTVAGSNNVNFNLNSGGTAYIGGANTGNLSFSGNNDTAVVGGPNTGTIQLPSGSVYVGGNSGTISTSGNSTIAINGNNSGNLNLNGSSTVSLAGSNSGTISLSGGSVTYTGSRGNMNLNGGSTATHVGSLSLTQPASTASSFATLFQTPLTQLSAQLDKLTPNSATSGTSGAIAFNASPDKTGTAVFDINASLFAPNSTITLNLNSATTVIINVMVGSCVSTSCPISLPNSLNFADPTGYAENVLWNFVNATEITFGTEFGGSVLAPLAAVTNSSPIDGTLVAQSFSGQGEVHEYPFAGTIPGTTTNAPEPASLTLAATGIAALGAVRRRRTRRKAR
jgi:choice-of-anchor A domain-containing protein